MKANVDKLIERFLNSDHGKGFESGLRLNPVKILPISNKFKNLKLDKEDILLIHAGDQTQSDPDFILTDKQVHTIDKAGVVSQVSLTTVLNSNDEELKRLFSRFNQETTQSLIEFIDEIINPSPQITRKDFNTFIEKFKSFADQKASETKSYPLDLDFLNLLKREGDQAEAICKRLKDDVSFQQTLNLVMKNQDANEYEPNHVLLQDVIKVFNDCTGNIENKSQIAIKAKFVLAYLFERLQGRDMITSLSIERINALAESEKFDANISKIASARFLNTDETYQNEYILPSLLLRLQSFEFKPVGSFLYRIASIITKADGNINEAEKETLQLILQKLDHPKVKIDGAKKTEVAPDDSLEKVMDELNQLIGLEAIKKSVVELTNFLKVQKLREAEGLKQVNNSLHTVFMGPPGTGKTTVGRLLGRIYKHLGYLEKGHLVETDRAGMVAGYVGQTAMKVDTLVKEANGGVLFIDEAYSLASADNQRDFGHEAVEALLKRMEDKRSEFVVIAAGYPDEMESFIQTNPGLQSRFNRYFNFDHYTPTALLDIFKLFARSGDFELQSDAEDKLMEIFERLYEKRNPSFGNARVARNLFEKIIERQANRIISITPITKDVLVNITEADVPPILETVKSFILFEEENE